MLSSFRSITTILSFILSVGMISYGQESDTVDIEIAEPIKTVKVLAERSATSIVLRWAPSDSELWLACNRHGYKIQRIEINEDTKYDPEFFSTIAKVKPFTKDRWGDLLKAEDMPKYPSVAYECIYGAYKSLEMGSGIGAWKAQSEELVNKFSFSLFAADMEARTATLSGLRYEDDKIESGKIYLYKVIPNLPLDEGISYSDGVVVVNEDITEYPKIRLQFEEEEGRVILRWLRERYNKYYTAYWVERAIQRGAFERLDEFPFVHAVSSDTAMYTPFITYVDSVQNYTKYTYRVVGVTPFGNLGPLSSDIAAQAKDKTPPAAPKIIEAKYEGDSKIKLTWEYQSKEKIKGFDIFRGHKYEDNYYKINDELLSPSTRAFTDENAIELDQNFYYVSAIDTAGNAASSWTAYGVIHDTIPPVTPTGLVGEIDTNGVVTLNWDPNTELDILGYKVFFANADYHEFSLLTGHAIKQNSYRGNVTLKTLTRHAYFKIMAVDKSYNYSPLSESIQLVRPDTIPPSAPIFTEYSVEKDAINLAWANSSSSDLQKHILYRRIGKADWNVVTEYTTENSINVYRDEMIEEGKYYTYKIVAFDEAGLSTTTPNSLVLQAVNIKLKPPIEAMRLTQDESKKPKLNWSYPVKGDYKFVVYRGTESSGFKIHEILDDATKEYIDRSARVGQSYRYTVQVKFKDGTNSKFSPIEVAVL